eukprot:gene3944-5092_t
MRRWQVYESWIKLQIEKSVARSPEIMRLIDHPAERLDAVLDFAMRLAIEIRG